MKNPNAVIEKSKTNGTTKAKTAPNAKALQMKAIEKAKHVQSIAKAHSHLTASPLSGYPTPPSQTAFAEAFIYTKVYSNDRGFKLPSGAYASFDGTSWGVALGGGVTWMVATFFVPESEIFGDVTFNFNSAGGSTNLNFFKGSTPIGFAVGLGLGVSIGVTGGSGTFTQG